MQAPVVVMSKLKKKPGIKEVCPLFEAQLLTQI